MRPSEILAAKADEIREIIARYPVRNPRIFGSAARGDDEEGSDLDLLVDPLEGTTYFDLAGLELELGELLGDKDRHRDAGGAGAVSSPSGSARS